MKILFITMRKILPLNDGAFIYSYGILQYLKKQGADISFVSFYENQPYTQEETKQLKNICTRVEGTRLTWKSTALNMSFRYPNNIRKYTRKAMYITLRRIQKEETFDVVIIDHLQMFEYAKIFDKSKIVLIEHNVETQVWKNYAKKCSGLMKMAVKRSAEMTGKYETEALKKADSVISIAKTDAELLKQMSGRKDITIMHPYNLYDMVKDRVRNEKNEKKILFIGSFGWYPNQQAADFLVNNIMPVLRERIPGIKLYLVGKEPTDKIINYAKMYRDVIVTGMVESVDPYIAKSDVFVNAMFDGSGMNIKMMEAMGKGIPVVTSEFGCRGINIVNGEQAFVFKNEEECVDEIVKIIENDDIADGLVCKARSFYEAFIEPDEDVRKAFLFDN